jgi:hypothetical protein
MQPRLEVLQKHPPSCPDDFFKVSEVAKSLLAYLQRDETRAVISASHHLGASSADIQAILLEHAQSLGFRSEKRGLFSCYRTPGLRPDYYARVASAGVLMEVERGKIIANNMDMVDLWKCHLCLDADYLFLIVPQVRHRENGRAERIFDRVVNRLSTFFLPETYVNVEAVFIIGY